MLILLPVLVLPVLVLPMLVLPPRLAAAQTTPEKRAALDKMLDALRTAPDEQVAGAMEQTIVQSWIEASTPAVTLLMAKGIRTMQGEANDEAIDVFSDAILLDPALAEAWHRRAIARFQSGDIPGAIADIRETLRLEPRHFGAWRTLVRTTA